MSPEVIPFPQREPTLDTPETSRECLDLARMVDDQVASWRARAHVHAVRMPQYPYNLAQHIVEDCSPLGREPVDYLSEAHFGGTMTREDARLKTAYEKRRAQLSGWVAREELDAITAHNQAYAGYIGDVALAAENPMAPAEFGEAIHYLQRLFILREQLAIKIGKVTTLEATDFIDVATYLGDRL